MNGPIAWGILTPETTIIQELLTNPLVTTTHIKDSQGNVVINSRLEIAR